MEKVVISSEVKDAFDALNNYCGKSKLLIMRFYVEYEKEDLSNGNGCLSKYLEIINSSLDSEEFMKVVLGEYTVELTPIQKAESIMKEYKEKINSSGYDQEVHSRYNNRYYAAKEILDLWKESLK